MTKYGPLQEEAFVGVPYDFIVSYFFLRRAELWQTLICNGKITLLMWQKLHNLPRRRSRG